MRYLIKLKPLEPYTFGTEQRFEYPGEKSVGKTSYFVTSGMIPEQTTIWGMLRFWILSNNGKVKSNFHYTDEEKEFNNSLIGSESFKFQASEKQSFGKLKCISPVFLMNEKDEILVKNPFCNKCKYKYRPIKMSTEQPETSEGKIRLPIKKEYDAKCGYLNGFFNLKTKHVETDFFETHLISGNRKNNKGESDEGCFFKREVVTFAKDKQGYSFAFYLDVEEDLIVPKCGIVYMGLKQSAFQISAVTSVAEDLNIQVEKAFRDEQYEPWFYALSDLYINTESFTLDTFSIIEEKHLRNIETKYDNTERKTKITTSPVRYSLIQSGSSFFEKCSLDLDNNQVKQLGYNQIVQLGGCKK